MRSYRLALAVVAATAVAVFFGSLDNGFAYDDQGIIVQNPVVTDGDVVAALGQPYWAGEAGVGRLYRPVAQAAFAAQWRAFGGEARAFHMVNVLLHALVATLVAVLCGQLVHRWRPEAEARERAVAALLGGAFFAVHPVHVEAVANVVGQAELWAALGVVGGVVVHLGTRSAEFGARVMGTLGVGTLFAVGFGAKEIAIVLPALLLLIEAGDAGGVRALAGRLLDHLPRVLLLAGVGCSMLVARLDVLGALAGEDVTAALAGLGTMERLAHVFPLWTEYLRLLVWPMTLAADYDPGVVYPASGPSVLQTTLGLAVLIGGLAAIPWCWKRQRLVAVGAAWFAIAILPVSNLLFATGSLMAERTLFLPSVGWSLVVAGLGSRAWSRAARPRTIGLAAVVVALLLGVRSITRVPSWESSFTVMQTLVRDHPTSWRSHKARAEGLVNVGRFEDAAEAYRAGVAALPNRFDMVAATGAFFKEQRRLAEARPYLESAVALQPARPSPWVLLAELELLEGRFREAHSVATRGIASAVESAELWGVLSEAYVGGGLLDAAVRARRVSLALEPGSAQGWTRLAELLEAAGGNPEAIAEARRRAAAEGG